MELSTWLAFFAASWAISMSPGAADAVQVLHVRKSESHLKAMNRVFGALFVAAGTLLALFKRAA